MVPENKESWAPDPFRNYITLILLQRDIDRMKGDKTEQ